MKYSRKVRKCASEMVRCAALVKQSEVNEIITRLHMQLDKAIEEADKKVNENVSLTKELGQVKREVAVKVEEMTLENSKVISQNEALSKELNLMIDNCIALKDENNRLERFIIDQAKSLQEKDDLIKHLQTPWYRRIFKHDTV